jgi:hypothetical protein
MIAYNGFITGKSCIMACDLTHRSAATSSGSRSKTFSLTASSLRRRSLVCRGDEHYLSRARHTLTHACIFTHSHMHTHLHMHTHTYSHSQGRPGRAKSAYTRGIPAIQQQQVCVCSIYIVYIRVFICMCIHVYIYITQQQSPCESTICDGITTTRAIRVG